MLSRQLLRAAVVLSVVLASRPALGWSRSLHRSILEGALRVSPAAAARIPETYRDVVLRACEGTDASERLGDPGAEAEQLLRALLARPAGKFGHNDALALGRLLHDVANGAVPPDTKPSGPGPEELLSGREIAVYRDPAPRAASLAEALRASRQDCSFAQDRLEDLGAKYRAAVQATIDALHRLPALRAPETDAGLDVFIVADRVDNGKSGAREIGKSYRGWVETDNFGDEWDVLETTTWFDMSQAGKGKLVRKSYEIRGVHLMEWTSRREGAITRNRLLVLNNTGSCVPTLRVQVGRTKTDVPAGLAPHAIGRIEFETSAETPRADVRLLPQPVKCAAGPAPRGGAVASRLFGVPATVTVSPRWDEAFHAPFPEENPRGPLGGAIAPPAR